MAKKKTPSKKAASKKTNTNAAKKQTQAAADRQARARENYAALKAAGFSSTEAARYRYSSPANIKAAIEAKALPALQTKKRGAKTKIETSEIQHPYVRQQVINIAHTGERYISNVEKYMKLSQGSGYTHYSLTLTFTWATGQQTFASTTMNDISGLDDLAEEIAAVLIYYLERYSQGGEDPEIDVEVNLWDYSHKSKRAG